MNSETNHRPTNTAFTRSNSRVSSRADVEIVAAVREPGLGSMEVMVLDLSITGFRMRCMTRLTGEKAIFLKLPSFAALGSKICWQQGDYFGCEFLQSLHPAVYNHIIAQYPSLQLAS